VILSEEEAKTKWCPMVRYSQNFNDLTSNRPGEYDHPYCMASDCMMWRWENQEAWIDRIEEMRKTSPKMSTQELSEIFPRKGFCGLGGKP